MGHPREITKTPDSHRVLEITLTTATTLDPAAAISAAVRELYDELRAIVDRGPTDDPGLLDELGKLTGRIRGRITRARKRAAAEATSSSRREEDVAKPVNAPTSMVENTTRPTAGQFPAKQDNTAGQHPGQPPRTVPAAVQPSGPRVTVPVEPRRSGFALMSAGTTAGCQASRSPLPRWFHALVILLMVAGVVLTAATGTGWWLSTVLAGPVLVGVASRWRIRRDDPNRERSR